MTYVRLMIDHRVRYPCHVGRDGIVRPSVDNETLGSFIFHVIIPSFLSFI
jgi:hypothetical protein